MVSVFFVLMTLASPDVSGDPVGGIKVDIQGVLSAGDNTFVVVLASREPKKRFMPIWIGVTEAINIKMRKMRQAPPRPLTLYLLESVLKTSGITVTGVRVDGLEDGVFIGSLMLRKGERTWRLDARPSDALGLAAGCGAPIWVDPEVWKEASVSPDEKTETHGVETL